jgi:deazaflavin-dependent oxidoreductase (nitroreductase family)
VSSSFTAANGTRGARQPGRWVKLINRITARSIRKGGQFGGMDALVLHTVGRKSGELRQNPVGYFPGPDGSFLIVASANGGPRNPAWYHNLAARPEASVQTAGRTVKVTARELHGAERQEAWELIVATSPRFGQYQEKTDRKLPVIQLTPTGD